MLIYESTGFLEAEVGDLKQLSRSKASVPFGGEGAERFDLQVILCEYQDRSEARCRVAFYAKALKRSLVFTASGTDSTTAWQDGIETLGRLGFDLEGVNLKLSPAMLEVVLKDVPGYATPTVARSQRTELTKLLAEAQRQIDTDPDGPEGKKAALKLNAEKRLEDRCEKLRQLLDEILSPESKVSDEVDALLAQVKDLTARLEESDKRVESERNQREFSESITSAAEKRIQELEEVLVDVETKSSGEMKLKRKIGNLQSKIKGLEEELRKVRAEIEVERDKQGKFVDDVKATQDQMSALEAQLNDKIAESDQLAQDLSEAELRLKVQAKSLQIAERRVVEHEESQSQLAKAEKALAKEKAAAKDECERERSIRKRLERCAHEDEKRIAELEDALANSGSSVAELTDSRPSLEIDQLRCQLDGELTARQGLEKDLEEAHKMIDSLEKMIREREGASDGWGLKEGKQGDEDRLKKLEGKLTQLEAQLEQELLEQKRLAKNYAAAEKRLAEQDELLKEQEYLLSCPEVIEPDEAVEQETATAVKLLPHEVRPKPVKGAIYRPDWGLEGLPCTSSEQVLQAWETVFNVQLSIEGYPSQYCMAFLLVLREGKQKKVYMLFRLKMNKHTLVCVPSKKPKDEKSLNKVIEEGLTFLKMSGFEMESLSRDHIRDTLEGYFVGVE